MDRHISGIDTIYTIILVLLSMTLRDTKCLFSHDVMDSDHYHVYYIVDTVHHMSILDKDYFNIKDRSNILKMASQQHMQ